MHDRFETARMIYMALLQRWYADEEGQCLLATHVKHSPGWDDKEIDESFGRVANLAFVAADAFQSVARDWE